MLNYEAIAAQLSLSELAAVYNKYSDKPIKKFATKEQGTERTAKILADNQAKLADLKPFVNGKYELLERIPEKRETKLPGPKGKYAGKKLYKKVKDNPRREGTHGHTSFELITDGMTYEQYRAAGGRTNDLNWDVEHKFVEVK